MKRILQLAAVFLCMLLALDVSADTDFLSRLERKKLPKLKIPKVRVELLDNGMRCFLIEDHTLPVVKLKIITRVGNIYDPPDKVGLATLAGMNMRSGGAGDLSPEEFDAAVDDIGAVITSHIGREMGSASLAVLTGDLEKGLGLLGDMVFKPAFDEGRMKVNRLKIKEALRREKDNPYEYLRILFDKMLYGSDSPWARRPTPRSLSRIQTSDLREFHENYFRTNNMMLTASGDFDSGKLLKVLRKIMKKSPKGEVFFPEVPKVDLEFKPGARDVSAPLSQAFVEMGHFGVKRHNPDWFALYVMGNIFGAGNFKSRLMEDVRTKRGLAYSIRGRMTQGKDYGAFFVRFSTKAGQEDMVIGLVRKHMEELMKDGDVTSEELEFAKRSLLSSAIFDIDSPFKIVNDRARFHFYGYPPDYWRVSYEGISAVTKDDITRVAKKYLHPEGLKVLILGP